MFCILKDPKGEGLLLVLTPLEDDPCGNPLFFFDGSDQAVLFRSFTSIQHLQDIPPVYLEALAEADNIRVIEFSDEQIERAYDAFIEHVPDAVGIFTKR